MARSHYVTTSRGQLGIVRAGEGPPVVLLPGLTEAASFIADRYASAHPGRSWVAMELPGIGGSAGVTFDRIEDAREVLAEALLRLDLAHAPVVAHDLAIAFVVEGPLAGVDAVLRDFSSANAWAAGSHLPPDLSPRPDGAHLTAFWAHVRNACLLDPLDPRRPRRDGPPLPTPSSLNAFTTRAMVRPRAYERLWRLCIETLAVLPRARDGGDLDGILAQTSRSAPFGEIAAAQLSPSGITCDYVDTPEGRLHLRRSGLDGRPLMVLQSAPGSTAPLSRLIETFGGNRRVFAPDYPGNGDSEKPSGPMDIPRLAKAMWAAADALGLNSLDLWGTHTGALVALDMAIQRPERIDRLVLEAPPLLSGGFTADILANYLPALVPDRWGLHLQQAWNMRRDMFLFWPWYRESRSAARDLGLPDASMLHDWTMGLLKSGGTYDLSYRAAFEYPTADRLPLLTRPALVCAGPTDMLVDGLQAAQNAAPDLVSIAATPATFWYPNQGEAEIVSTLDSYASFLNA